MQIGITLVGIVAGAFGQATLARVLGAQFDAIPLLEPCAVVISVWLLGFVVMSAIGFYAYVLRFLFWDRTTPYFGGRVRSRDMIQQIKRQ